MWTCWCGTDRIVFALHNVFRTLEKARTTSASDMSDRWENLRDRFKKKDIDLDAEFEKFLNEVSKLSMYA